MGNDIRLCRTISCLRQDDIAVPATISSLRSDLDLDILSLREIAERAAVGLGAFGKGIAAERADVVLGGQVELLAGFQLGQGFAVEVRTT